MRGLLLVLLLLLAGCAQPALPQASSQQATSDAPSTLPAPSPTSDGNHAQSNLAEPPHEAAVNASQAWVLLSGGCGFCGGDPDGAGFWMVAVQQDGLVLLLQYSTSTAAATRSGLERFQQFLDGLPAGTPIYGVRANPPRVLGATVGLLGAAEWDEVRQGLDASLQAHGGQVHNKIDSTDCGPSLVVAFGEPHAGSARDGCGTVAGEGWQEAMASLKELEAWVRTVEPATRAGVAGTPVPRLVGGWDTGIREVRASMVVQACGGAPHGCSGRTTFRIWSDGLVDGVWGAGWAPGTEAPEPCGFDEPPAPECKGGRRAGAHVPAAAWPAVRDHLDRTSLDAPVSAYECCDRVHTTVRLFLDGAYANFTFEGTELDATSPLVDAVPLLGQMLDLSGWLRPSLQGQLWIEAPKTP